MGTNSWELVLGRVSTSIDMSEVWAEAEAVVSGKNMPSALASSVMKAPPVSVENLRKQIQKSQKDTPLLHLVPAVITDGDGKTIKRIPSMLSDDPADREAAMRHHMVHHANMHQDLCGASWVEAGRRAISREHEVVTTDLLPLVTQSPFVPSGREFLWAKAFSAGFEGDFTQAAHLLVPQLEHALRMALRARGHNPVSVDKLMQQEDWNFNEILLGSGRVPTLEILGEDLLFDLAALLVDRSGANLRNAIAHGKVADGGLKGGLSRYLFIACLRLCVLPLVEAARARQRSLESAAAAPE
jgi:hypothetical protein